MHTCTANKACALAGIRCGGAPLVKVDGIHFDLANWLLIFPVFNASYTWIASFVYMSILKLNQIVLGFVMQALVTCLESKQHRYVSLCCLDARKRASGGLHRRILWNYLYALGKFDLHPGSSDKKIL